MAESTFEMRPSLKVVLCPEDSGAVMVEFFLCCHFEDWPFNKRGGYKRAVLTAQVLMCIYNFSAHPGLPAVN